MNLDIEKWKPFVTKKLFPVLRPGKANQQMLDEGNDCFYIGAKKDDNGVMLHCALNNELIQEGNCIIFICNGQGSVGYANYMDIDFIGTTDIIAGYNDNLNPFVGNFLATIYSLERPKYSFGRKWKTHLEETEIMLPAKKNEDGSFYFDSLSTYSDQGFVPDWHFMEDYIKSLHYKPISTQNKRNGSVISVNEWKEFKVGDFFDIRPTKTLDGLTADDCTNSGVPLVVNSAENNGIAGFCDREATEEGNIITFSDTTDGNAFFYQPGPFIGFAHVQGMYPKTREWSSFELLFFLTVLKFDSKDRFSYGRKMRRDIILETKIKLPQTSNGTPDWQYMEDYIKNLPYGDRIKL